jgi:hypothetical protein
VRIKDAAQRTKDAGMRIKDAWPRTKDAGVRIKHADERIKDAAPRSSRFDQRLAPRRQHPRQRERATKVGRDTPCAPPLAGHPTARTE